MPLPVLPIHDSSTRHARVKSTAIIAGFIKNKIAKAFLSVLNLMGVFVLSIVLAVFVLPAYLGIHGVWLSFALCGTAFGIGTLFIWKPFTPKTRRVVALSAAGALILSTAPTRENIVSGTYPLANDFYAITARRDGAYLHPERAENIDRLLDWILSPQGQFLVDATGYVPLQ